MPMVNCSALCRSLREVKHPPWQSGHFQAAFAQGWAAAFPGEASGRAGSAPPGPESQSPWCHSCCRLPWAAKHSGCLPLHPSHSRLDLAGKERTTVRSYCHSSHTLPLLGRPRSSAGAGRLGKGKQGPLGCTRGWQEWALPLQDRPDTLPALLTKTRISLLCKRYRLW